MVWRRRAACLRKHGGMPFRAARARRASPVSLEMDDDARPRPAPLGEGGRRRPRYSSSYSLVLWATHAASLSAGISPDSASSWWRGQSVTTLSGSRRSSQLSLMGTMWWEDSPDVVRRGGSSWRQARHRCLSRSFVHDASFCHALVDLNLCSSVLFDEPYG